MRDFGINLWNWVDSLGPDCLGLPSKIARMGFTAVELPMTEPIVDSALGNEIRCNGLQVSLCAAMSAGRDLSNFDAGIRRNTMDYLLRCLETAEQLGARVLAGPLYTGGGKRHWLSPEDQKREWDLAVTGLTDLAGRADQHHVLLALEPLNRYRSSVANTASQVLRMVKDIGKNCVGVHFDTFHAGIEEDDLCSALEAILIEGKLYHVHACSNNRGEPGRGYFPWNRIWELLRTYQYEGHITMETFAPGGLDSGWLQMGDGPDQTARNGIEYLKNLL